MSAEKAGHSHQNDTVHLPAVLLREKTVALRGSKACRML